jgi:energy-coupling factor transporter ATP-binding protein EcfA2
LLALDEPTSQLDPVAGDELMGLLRRLNEDFDVAILLAEHRLERCLTAADRVIAMADGQIVCDASPSRFLEWAADAAPALCTPGARLLRGLGLPPVPGVKAARAAIRTAELEAAPGDVSNTTPPDRQPALRLDRVWHELRDGPVLLKSVSLTIRPGERVALMGRNGAGKSTLLRHAAGLLKPTRGKVQASGRVALLLQNPNDYLVHETVAQEAPALERFGLDVLAQRHPRDLSGGEKQRLALAIVLGDPEADRPAVTCLDEPTRGMDRGLKDALAEMLRAIDGAVLVATHDPEFVAAFADRVILLADGAPVADGPTSEVLAGGTYFATETARILGGAGGALRPDDAIRLLRPISTRA